MTVNVSFSVPPYIAEVHVWTESWTAEYGWKLTSSSPLVYKAGTAASIGVHDTFRIVMIQEVVPAPTATGPHMRHQADAVRDACERPAPLTINEVAHGHE